MRAIHALVLAGAALASCGRLDHVGKPPDLSAADTGREHLAMSVQGLPRTLERRRTVDEASLWTGANSSLLGDRRASATGDILTVVINIDEQAAISNSSQRSRTGEESLSIGQLFGLPQRLDRRLPDGASSDEAVGIESRSSSEGDGSVRRREELTLRMAATVTEVLPSGVLRIEGSQEVRVNFELRELLVSGYVRPDDISRDNEITYDRIAGARISYGGRGQITDVQQPRWGQQITDIILPY